MENIDLSVVVPVYNEEGNIKEFLARITPILRKIGSYEVIFCIDPSKDNTEEEIEKACRSDSSIRYLMFSRRVGQPSAVMAGILNCNGDACVVIDVDLQDPPELILEMHQKLLDGYEVVYAKRRSRKGETWIKRLVSYLGYWVINAASDVEIPRDTGDFRVISRRVVEELRRLRESHGFLRGLVALVGFKQGFIEFDRDNRAHGVGNYNRYLGSLKIGLNGLVGFSTFLLTCTLISGILISIASFFLALGIVISKLYFGQNYPVGTPTIIILILFMGGIQLISIGILGEYIGRIYEEVKHRPRFVIERTRNMGTIRDTGSRD